MKLGCGFDIVLEGSGKLPACGARDVKHTVYGMHHKSTGVDYWEGEP